MTEDVLTLERAAALLREVGGSPYGVSDELASVTARAANAVGRLRAALEPAVDETLLALAGRSPLTAAIVTLAAQAGAELELVAEQLRCLDAEIWRAADALQDALEPVRAQMDALQAQGGTMTASPLSQVSDLLDDVDRRGLLELGRFAGMPYLSSRPLTAPLMQSITQARSDVKSAYRPLASQVQSTYEACWALALSIAPLAALIGEHRP